MKKFLAIIMIFTLTISFWGCGNSEPEQSEDQQIQTSEDAAQAFTPLTPDEIGSIITPEADLLKLVKQDALSVVLQPFKGIIKKPGNLQSIKINADSALMGVVYPAGTYGSLEDIASEYGGAIQEGAYGKYVEVISERYLLNISIEEESAEQDSQYITFFLGAQYYDEFNPQLMSLVSDGVYPETLFDAIKEAKTPLLYEIEYNTPMPWSSNFNIVFHPQSSEADIQDLADLLTAGFKNEGYAEGKLAYLDENVLLKKVNIDGQDMVYFVRYQDIATDGWCSIEHE